MMNGMHVLVVDDEESICTLLARLLRERGYETTAETDATRTLEHLRSGRFDALLLDMVMPAMGGLDLLKEIRLEFRVLPVLVITGHGSIETAVESMRNGASDFVTKPVDSALLDLRIQQAVDLERTRRLAKTDALTGLYNHRTFQERLLEEIERSRRHGRPLSLIMGDLDKFKTINDTYGHPRGDEVLIAVSQILRDVSRTYDIAARYGGEEFALILPETSAGQAENVALRAKERVSELSFDWEREDAECDGPAMSLGVAEWWPGAGPKELLSAADEALYEAKRQGRNRVCVHVPARGQEEATGPDTSLP